MTMKRAARLIAPIGLAGFLLSGCVLIPDDDAICDEDSPNTGSWPYCAPAEPGGPGPVDDPIDPSGPGR